MLALNIALGTIILLVISVAIKMKTGGMKATEIPGTKNEKLIQEQDAQSHGPPSVIGSTTTSQTTIVNIVENASMTEPLTTTQPGILDTSSAIVENVEDQNWAMVSQESIENRTEPANMENTTVGENVHENVHESVSEEVIVFDRNAPQKLEVLNDTIINQLSRGTISGSALYWPFVTYSLNIFR